MVRGFFRMDYVGHSSSGWGALAFVDGKIAGMDVAGGNYLGDYACHSDGRITGEVLLTLPTGGVLVTGAIVPLGAPPIPISFEIEGEIEGRNVRLETPTGPVEVIFRKISPL
jgi:hypothetical protein